MILHLQYFFLHNFTSITEPSVPLIVNIRIQLAVTSEPLATYVGFNPNVIASCKFTGFAKLLILKLFILSVVVLRDVKGVNV